MNFSGQNSVEELFPSLNQELQSASLPQYHSMQEPEPQIPVSAQSLFQSRQKLAKFSQSLGQFRKSELRTDVLAHCCQLNRTRKVIHNYISDQTVLRMAGSRIDKMLKNRKIKKNWSEQDLKILIWTVSKYADMHSIADLQKDITVQDWHNIAQLIPGVTPSNCMFKWLSIKKTNLSVKHWLDFQANMLKDIVQQQLLIPGMHPNIINWKSVSEQLYQVNPLANKAFRSAKQCREHWNCYLNPHLKKGPWELAEDIQLLELIRGNNGEKKWSEIVYSFEGRTENALKNRYTLLIDKQKKMSKSKQQRALVQDCLARCRVEEQNNNKQQKRNFINHILSYPQETIKQQQKEEQIQPEGDLINDCLSGHDGTESNRDAISLTSGESPSTPQQPQVIKFCRIDNFDFLRQIALSREVRPGYLRNNVFQPE